MISNWTPRSKNDGLPSHVGRAVVLQMGHRFFRINHSLMQSVWKLCPQSTTPRSSPSVYSSCRNKVLSKIDDVNINMSDEF